MLQLDDQVGDDYRKILRHLRIDASRAGLSGACVGQVVASMHYSVVAGCSGDRYGGSPVRSSPDDTFVGDFVHAVHRGGLTVRSWKMIMATGTFAVGIALGIAAPAHAAPPSGTVPHSFDTKVACQKAQNIAPHVVTPCHDNGYGFWVYVNVLHGWM